MFPKTRHRPIRLVEAKSLTPSVRSLSFELTDGEPFDFVAGQYVDLFVRTEGGETIKRSYSIASSPMTGSPARFEIAVTRVEGGPVSNVVHGMGVGDMLEMLAPSGLFTRLKDPVDVPAVFVGTGTGLSPLRSMILDELAKAPDGPPLTLLFGCRAEEDVLWRDELRELTQRFSRLRYEVTLSRAAESWTGRRGYVQSHLRELIADPGRTHVYVCGLSKMVGEVRELLKTELGLDRKQIHSERYD